MPGKTKIVIALVPDDGGNYLSLYRNKGAIDGINMSFPSGKVEDDESERAAVKREVKEETGIEVKPVERLGKRELSDGSLAIYWLCKKVGGELTQEKTRSTFDPAFRPTDEIRRLSLPRTLSKIVENHLSKA